MTQEFKSLQQIKNEVAKEYRMKNFSTLLKSIHPTRLNLVIDEISKRYGKELVKKKESELFESK